MAGEIFIADKATLDAVKTDTELIKGYVDTAETTLGAVNTKIGANADAAGTTTVFARLRQIYEYLTTNLATARAAKIENLDAAISTRAAASSLTTLDGKIGVANPVSGGTDTVMNYLKKLDGNTSGGQAAIPRKARTHFGTLDYNNIHKNTWRQLLSVSGKGKITRLSLATSWSVGITLATTAKFRLTVDGVSQEFPLSATANTGYASLVMSLNTVNSTPFNFKHDMILDVYFDTSFVLEFFSNDNMDSYSFTLYDTVDYALV